MFHVHREFKSLESRHAYLNVILEGSSHHVHVYTCARDNNYSNGQRSSMSMLLSELHSLGMHTRVSLKHKPDHILGHVRSVISRWLDGWAVNR